MLPLTRIERTPVADLLTDARRELGGSPGALAKVGSVDMLTLVERELVAYLLEPGLTGEEEDDFPSRRVLTGTYYLESIYDHGLAYNEIRDEHRFRLSVMCCLLGLGPFDEPDDYLGLEVHLSWPEHGHEARVDGVDSSSI